MILGRIRSWAYPPIEHRSTPTARRTSGRLTDALVQTNPSDLDLWSLWALVEYVGATRDFAFLDQSVPYHPPTMSSAATVLERVARSLDRLGTTIGVGAHGLLKVGTGDWNDGIRLLAGDAANFASGGESVFNSAFAAYVLRRVADLVASRGALLAQRCTAFAAQMATAVAAQFDGQWFRRRWDGSCGPIGDDQLFLEHHTWLLISDVATADQRAAVTRKDRR
jgi:cellobiose phosphorylase